jgi:hypothetical protein
MASDTINRIFDTAKIRLPGALDAALLLEFFIVVDELLKASRLWKELLPFTAVPAPDPYIVDPSAYTFPLAPAASTLPVTLLGVYDSEEHPWPATMPVPGQIVLGRLPTAAKVLHAHVTLTVTEPAEIDGLSSIPDWIVERYWTLLLNGLLGRMMSQQAKPYTSLAMATQHMRAFYAGVSKARIDGDRQNVYGAQNWHFPRNFVHRKR